MRSILQKSNKKITFKLEEITDLDWMVVEVHMGALPRNIWDKWCPLGLNDQAMEGALRYKMWEYLKGPYKAATVDLDEFGRMCLALFNGLVDQVWCEIGKSQMFGWDHGGIKLTCSVDHDDISVLTLFTIYLPLNMDIPVEHKEQEFILEEG